MRILLILLVLYVLYRIVRGFMRTQVIIKSFHYQDNRSYNRDEPEGKVTIKNPGSSKRPGQISSDSGEYIDYEETKS